MSIMKKQTPLAILLLISLYTLTAFSQTASINGTITDSETSTALSGANVTLTSTTGLTYGASTDSSGQYIITRIRPGTYAMAVSYIGYEEHVDAELVLRPGESRRIDVALKPASVEMQPVEIAATRQTIDRRSTEKLEPYASVTILDTLQLQSRYAMTPADYLTGLAGVDVVKTGINQNQVAIRGFNDVLAGSMLLMVDNRIARVPSLRFNAFSFLPSSADDIERIEIIRGPAASLYGPNSANGVLHIITKSPFDSQGTTLSFGVGQRNTFTADLRFAAQFNEQIAYKIAGNYIQGFDFESRDAFEDSLRARLFAADESYRQRGLANPNPLDEYDKRIAVRDFAIRKLGITAQIDYRVTNDLLLVTNGGYNLATNMELTPIGGALVDNWRYGYAQTKLIYHNLFAQAFFNTSHSGDTYSTRDGHPIVDKSGLVTFQIQNTTSLGRLNVLTYGFDYYHTLPVTEGTVHGNNEHDDQTKETGFYGQWESTLGSKFRLQLAGRMDFHNRIEDPFVSPRAGMVFLPEPNHKIRLSVSRGFSTPTVENQFLDRLISPIIPDRLISFSRFVEYQPFNVWVRGVPESGYTFGRDSEGGVDGLYMQPVPLYLMPPMNHDLVPADATLLWDRLVEIITEVQGSGLDYAFSRLEAAPAPTYEEVQSVLKAYNVATGEYESWDPSAITNIDRLQSTKTTSVELGYSATIGKKFLFNADVYHNRISDFIGPLLLETPNVFLDRETLEAYLLTHIAGPVVPTNPRDAFVTASRVLARMMSEIPLGTVVPDQSIHPGDLMLSYRNFGDIDLTGLDLDFIYLAGNGMRFSGAYSFVSKDLFQSVDNVRDIALNAPKHKYSLALQYRRPGSGFGWEISYRHVNGFPVNSGVFIGEVQPYDIFDVSAGIDLPGESGIRLLLTVQNAFDNKHSEFVGAPVIGRYTHFQIQVFPDQ